MHPTTLWDQLHAPWTVTQLTQAVRNAIRGSLPDPVWVTGEISNFKAHSSGHWYFTIKDATSELSCVTWRSENQRMRFTPRDGMEVLARGDLDVFERSGRYQMYVRSLEAQGTGHLELAFRQLHARLEREGLFDPARKRPVPRVPSRLGLITSSSGAAIRDILRTLERRFPCVEVLFHPVRVQGAGAAREIVTAIQRLGRAADLDAIILARGGGSIEDLWAFNEEPVARAIFGCTVPIIAGIGHEVDVTIADLVADVRAATPTAAAELAVPLRDELLEDLDNARRQLLRALIRRQERARQTLDGLSRREPLRAPRNLTRGPRQQLDLEHTRLQHALSAHTQGYHHELGRWTHRLGVASPRPRVALSELRLTSGWQALQQAMLRALQRCTVESTSLGQRLEGVSHMRVLQRGYTVTVDVRSGGMLLRADQVRPGQHVRTHTAMGSFDSRVIPGNAQQMELFH